MDKNLLVQDFYRSTLAPIRLYENNRLVNEFADRLFNPNPITAVLPYVSENPSPLGYIITDEHLFLGFVRVDGTPEFYTIGPTCAFRPTAVMARRVLKAMGQKVSHEELLLGYLQKIPAYSVSQSRHMLSVMDFFVNGKTERAIQHIPVTDLKISGEPEEDALFSFEHISPDVENNLTSFVEYGRPDLMEKYLDNLLTHRDGVPDVSPNADRAIKNIFIFSMGIISRTALNAGLPYDMVVDLRTYFLTRVEEKNGYAQVTDLIRKMFMAFSNAVALIKNTPSGSPTVYKIQQTALSNMYEKITPAMIAEKMEMALPYLCRHFKSQTGKTISSYINEIKIEEAKRLLSSTRKGVLDISEQLGFSSPNYMATVFRKITGVTPDGFRRSCRQEV